MVYERKRKKRGRKKAKCLRHTARDRLLNVVNVLIVLVNVDLTSKSEKNEGTTISVKPAFEKE